MRKEKKYTLTELLITVLIITLIAGGIVVSLDGIEEESARKIAVKQMIELDAQIKGYKTSTGVYPNAFDSLMSADFFPRVTLNVGPQKIADDVALINSSTTIAVAPIPWLSEALNQVVIEGTLTPSQWMRLANAGIKNLSFVSDLALLNTANVEDINLPSIPNEPNSVEIAAIEDVELSTVFDWSIESINGAGSKSGRGAVVPFATDDSTIANVGRLRLLNAVGESLVASGVSADNIPTTAQIGTLIGTNLMIINGATLRQKLGADVNDLLVVFGIGNFCTLMKKGFEQRTEEIRFSSVKNPKDIYVMIGGDAPEYGDKDIRSYKRYLAIFNVGRRLPQRGLLTGAVAGINEDCINPELAYNEETNRAIEQKEAKFVGIIDCFGRSVKEIEEAIRGDALEIVKEK